MNGYTQVVVLGALCLGGAIPSLAAQETREPVVVWSDLDVPGTPTAFARAAGLAEGVDPDRILLEWIRVRDLPHETGELRVKRVRAYLAILEAFTTTHARLGQQISLGSATRDRRNFEAFLDVIGLSLTQPRRGVATVSRSTEQATLESRAILMSAGVKLEGVEERLNAGESIRLELPSFKTALPMSPDWWRNVVFRQSARSRDLFRAIVDDANASYLYYGLSSTSRATRAYLAGASRLVTSIYEDHAPAFARVAGNLRIQNGQVDVPGGNAARNYWEALVNIEVSEPQRFVESVLGADSGRLAYFYSRIDALDPPRLRFALGLYEQSQRRSPRSQITALYRLWFQGFQGSDRAWAFDAYPFARPNLDPLMLLIQVAVDEAGRPVGPAWRFFWNAVFDDSSLPNQRDRESDRLVPVDALFLIEAVFRPREISPEVRLAVFLFAQRVFVSTPEERAPEIFEAVRGFLRFRMLHSTLERIGIRSPATHAIAARAASRLGQIENADTAHASQSQFQGAMALLAASTLAGRLTTDRAASLIESLSTLELNRDGSYGNKVALWLDRLFIPAVANAHQDDQTMDVESLALAGILGVTPTVENKGDGQESVFEWEGWQYRIDVRAALVERTSRIRQRQSGNTLGAVLAFARVAELVAKASTSDEVDRAIAVIGQLQKQLSQPTAPQRLSDRNALIVGRTLGLAIRELDRIKTRRPIVERAARVSADRLEPVAAVLTADILRALVYAVSTSDPESPMFAGGDVSHRHDFGLGSVTRDEREQMPWALATYQTGRNGKTGGKGSLLGLDIALADGGLRRAASAAAVESPYWSGPDRRAFAQAVVLFNPFDARLKGMQRVADAIKRGRDQVLESVPGRLDSVLAKARIGPLRRALIDRTLERNSSSLVEQFSVLELLRLGGDGETFALAQAWGAPSITLSGCLCLALPPPVDWEAFGGRNIDWGLLAPGSPDLLLRLAELSSEMGLPSSLAHEILPFAVRAVLDGSQLAHQDDWPAIMQFVTRLSRQTVEDFVSRLTAESSMIPLAPGVN